MDTQAEGFERYPRSFAGVVIDRMEMLYLAGFPLLHLIVTVLPLLSSQSPVVGNPVNTSDHSANATMVTSPPPATLTTSMEFLPLLLTSVYCAIGLLWAYIRLGAVYVADMMPTA
jgi:alpha-1,3-glucosyltransferase